MTEPNSTLDANINDVKEPHPEESSKDYLRSVLSDKTYNFLKWFALIALPALGTLYFILSAALGLPYGEKVMGVVSAVMTFLGILLGISTSSYNRSSAFDGSMVVSNTNSGKTLYSLELDTPIEDLPTKDSVVFKVK